MTNALTGIRRPQPLRFREGLTSTASGHGVRPHGQQSSISQAWGDHGIYEMSCSNLITIAKAKGVWLEDESVYGSSAHPAQIGDGIIYDWDDDGKGDCKGAPEHVGMITEVHPGYMVITEGNFSRSVKKRTVLYNAKQIRGFICPDYDAAVNGIPETVAPTVQPSTPATTGTINTGTNIPMYNLYRGNKGETVRTAQALLNLRLQLTGTKNALDTDGSFGPLTESMVEKYNKSIGNSGKAINGVTWNHLMKGG